MLKRYLCQTLNRGYLKFLLIVMAWLIIGMGLVYAIELPPSGSKAFIQTTGPNANLGIGDFYTNAEPGAGNDRHIIEINVPCSWPGDRPITFALFDPESTGGTITGPPPAVDERRPSGSVDPADDDDTTFTLTAPGGAIVSSVVFTPTGGSNGLWVELATITPDMTGCGNYVLETTTADDDDNAWRLKVNNDPDCDTAGSCSGISAANSALLADGDEIDNLDGLPGTGDELDIGLVQSSFQHLGSGEPCQDFFFFVDGKTSPLTLNNYDMDGAGSIIYSLPDGTQVDGTPSGQTEWNNGGRTDRGGDVFNIDANLVGWWQAELCIPEGNQYIFEAQEGMPIYFNQPGTPNMVIDKDDGKSVVTLGEAITHTIVFTNTSDTTSTPGTATNVTIVDNLPTGTTFESCDVVDLQAAYPGSSCNNTALEEVTVTISGNILPGQGGFFNIIVSVDDDASGTLTNTVTLNYEDLNGNQFAPVEAFDETLVPPPDLTLEKSDGGVTTMPGGTLVYTLNYTNVSSTDATGVIIGDRVPAHTTFNAAASSPNWTCVGGITCTLFLDDVAGNSSGSVDFAVDVDNPLPSGVTAINNSAAIADDSSKGLDPTPTNNIAADNTPLFLAPDMILSKTDGGITTTPGGTVVYTLSYTNVGPLDANNVIITETVPDNTTFSSAASTSTSWSCADGSVAGTLCTINVGVVAANGGVGSVTFGLVVDSPLSLPLASIVNTATIGDDSGLDPTPNDNSFDDDTPIEIIDPLITKAVDPNQAAIGDAVNFSITVSNPSSNSNSPAQNVLLTDPLPLEYDYVSSSVSSVPGGIIFTSTLITDVISTVGHPSGITQTVASTITIDIPMLGVDETVTLAVVATVNDLANPRPINIVNQATLDFEGGPQKIAEAQVLVPVPNTSPPTPSPEDNSNPTSNNDDDDDDDTATNSSPPPSPNVNPTVAPQPAAAAAPPFPVLLLPETGLKDSATSLANLALWGLALLGICLVLGYIVQRMKTETTKK